MSDYVIVRINEQLIPEFQINYNANESTAQSRNISSWSQIAIEANQELIILLSAAVVFSKEIKIPSNNEEIIKQSIPYALEEYLSNELEDNHFSYIKSHDDFFNVCVVNHTIMQQITSQLKKHELTSCKLIPELFTLPASKEMVSVINIDNYYIVNDNNEGTTLSEKLIQVYLENSKARSICIYSDKPLSLDLNNLDYKQIDTALYQSKLITNNRTINLFQGIYDQNTKKQTTLNPLKKVLSIAGLLLISWLFINLYQLWNTDKQINLFQNKQKNLLLKLVPNASQSELNAPYSAIESRLKLSQNSKTNKGLNGFIQSLLYVGQTLNKHQQIKVSTIRQRGRKLEIKIHAPNVTLLNKFQASLEKISLSRKVRTGTRESEKNGISSVVTMESF